MPRFRVERRQLYEVVDTFFVDADKAEDAIEEATQRGGDKADESTYHAQQDPQFGAVLDEE